MEMAKKGKVEKNQEKYDCFQICNILKLNDTSRYYVTFKYENFLLNLSEWKKLFKKDRLSF